MRAGHNVTHHPAAAVAAATQNQALSALLFLYKRALGRDLAWMDGMVRAKRPVRLSVVLSPAEAEALDALAQPRRSEQGRAEYRA